jgi:hypothetical protein
MLEPRPEESPKTYSQPWQRDNDDEHLVERGSRIGVRTVPGQFPRLPETREVPGTAVSRLRRSARVGRSRASSELLAIGRSRVELGLADGCAAVLADGTAQPVAASAKADGPLSSYSGCRVAYSDDHCRKDSLWSAPPAGTEGADAWSALRMVPLCVIPEGAGTVNPSDGDRLDGVPFPS